MIYFIKSISPGYRGSFDLFEKLPIFCFHAWHSLNVLLCLSDIDFMVAHRISESREGRDTWLLQKTNKHLDIDIVFQTIRTVINISVWKKLKVCKIGQLTLTCLLVGCFIIEIERFIMHLSGS